MSSSEEVAATTTSSSSSRAPSSGSPSRTRRRAPTLWVVLSGVVIVAVAVVAFVASGGTGGEGSLSGWVSASGVGRSIGTLESDGAHVRTLLVTGAGMGALHTLCAAMSNDAQSANGQLPAPDPEVTQLLAHAYGLEYDAAQACYRAGSRDAALLVHAAADRAAATRLFGHVVGRIRALTRHTVSTTTTPGVAVTGTAFG